MGRRWHDDVVTICSVCIAIFYEPKRIFIDFHCPFAFSLVSGWRRANVNHAVASSGFSQWGLVCSRPVVVVAVETGENLLDISVERSPSPLRECSGRYTF